ncbi:hypothetical protein [Lysobacter capsici]|uniref:hypothetical protein n=1 Tax=Lysobacter capsici TaxID=435897 RepID=UPI001C005801|nr:hypothetical protein [Lysobacter capsici]MBW8810454.1 hypothetical protein [Lysobacter sp.]QWF15293.1 hypothetical protein KME82_16010 [Lysobacter capsici]
MDFKAFDAWLADAIEKASPTQRMAFARDTIRQVIAAAHLDEVDLACELDSDASDALHEAMASALTAPADALKALDERIEKGVLTEGDMDPRLRFVFSAIGAWTDVLAVGDPKSLKYLADEAICQIDHRFEPNVNDFLACPQMQTERNRIATWLEA